jgi:Mlc titration factor MtfA (ptsG expression regulator)
LFSWFQHRRRKKLLDEPFPATWLRHIERNVRHHAFLDARGRKRMYDVVRVMVAERHWSGSRGFPVTDEMKVSVAAQASLLTLGLAEPFYFDRVPSIIIHPGEQTHSPTLQSRSFIVHEQLPVSGAAWQHGPITLSWWHVVEDGRDASDGANLVLHEFAHHLDGLDGEMGGMPPLDTEDQRRSWRRVTETEYHRLARSVQRGEWTLLDPYGATNQAEFFAVATECFFERPHAMRHRHRELYAILGDFYQQDPAQWVPDAR